MKKVAIIALGLFVMAGTTAFTVNIEKDNMVKSSGSTFKVLNNTGYKVQLKHKGGTVSLNNGSSTSLSCTREGNKIYIDGEHLHTVSSDDCGKTLKIKDWM